MKKTIILLLILIISLNYVYAEDLEVTSIPIGDILIQKTDNHAVFELEINNNGPSKEIEIYSLLVPITPVQKYSIPHGKTNIIINAVPGEQLRKTLGIVYFPLEIKYNSEYYSDRLRVKVIELEKVLEIDPLNVHPENKVAKVIIKNTEKAYLNNMKIKISSAFYEYKGSISFEPLEEKEIEVPIDKDISKIIAGPYITELSSEYGSAKAKSEAVFDFLEKEWISVHQDSSGLIISTLSVKKTNEGNVVANATFNLKKNIFTRLFTTTYPEPLVVREGFFVNYFWEETLAPTEYMEIKVTTNYTFPLLILIVFLGIVFFVRKILTRSVILTKRVYSVKTKGGEFALRVRLSVKARKHIDSITIVDTVPPMTTLYPQGINKPNDIDPINRRLKWKIPYLNKGEERVFTYIIHSKLRVLGRFELPSALVIFQSNGKTEEVSSNKTYFASEIRRSE